MESNNPELIAVTDVTDQAAEDAAFAADRKAAFEAVRPQVEAILSAEKNFIMVSIELTEGGSPMLTPIACCQDDMLEPMILGAISMLGSTIIGPAVEGIPEELRPHMILSAGLNHLNKRVIHSARQAQTPASDIGAGEGDPQDSVH